MKIAGLQEITTAMEGGLRSLPRTQDGSLDELAQLLREKARLLDRRDNWQGKIRRINRRLATIAARERPLLKRVAGRPLLEALAKEYAALPANADKETGHKKRLGGVLQY